MWCVILTRQGTIQYARATLKLPILRSYWPLILTVCSGFVLRTHLRDSWVRIRPGDFSLFDFTFVYCTRGTLKNTHTLIILETSIFRVVFLGNVICIRRSMQVFFFCLIGVNFALDFRNLVRTLGTRIFGSFSG